MVANVKLTMTEDLPRKFDSNTFKGSAWRLVDGHCESQKNRELHSLQDERQIGIARGHGNHGDEEIFPLVLASRWLQG